MEDDFAAILEDDDFGAKIEDNFVARGSSANLLGEHEDEGKDGAHETTDYLNVTESESPETRPHCDLNHLNVLNAVKAPKRKMKKTESASTSVDENDGDETMQMLSAYNNYHVRDHHQEQKESPEGASSIGDHGYFDDDYPYDHCSGDNADVFEELQHTTLTERIKYYR